MTAILGYADLLMSHEWPPSERREHLEVIHRQGNNLLTLINDILDLSKIEAEQVELEPMDCSPSEIMEEVRSLLQVRANEKNIGLDTTYAYPLPKTIRTDPLRLRQILVNLVGNAIKFTERGGVKVCVRYADQRMHFEIADTGIGISEEEIGRLFQPFTQADMSHTRRFGGTGLGLHISQRLAKLLGGQVEVESDPSVGSTFTLTIDPGSMENVEMETPTKTLPKKEEPIKRRKLHGRILLADDVPEIQTLVRVTLEAVGLDVDSADNGIMAVEKALASQSAGKPYDVILMDVQMPEMDGLEATRRLRQEGWERPIIALTAYAMTGDKEKCLAAGCDDYISKPMTEEAMFAAIGRCLGEETTIDTVSPELATNPLLDDDDKAEMVASFLENLPGRATAIEEAYRSGDLASLARLAHQLKGSAALFGFAQVSVIARELDQKATDGADLDELEATVAELATLCREAVGERRKK